MKTLAELRLKGFVTNFDAQTGLLSIAGLQIQLTNVANIEVQNFVEIEAHMDESGNWQGSIKLCMSNPKRTETASPAPAPAAIQPPPSTPAPSSVRSIRAPATPTPAPSPSPATASTSNSSRASRFGGRGVQATPAPASARPPFDASDLDDDVPF